MEVSWLRFLRIDGGRGPQTTQSAETLRSFRQPD